MAEKLIQITRYELDKLRALGQKSLVNKAISRGINYAVKKARTRAKEAVRKEYNLPANRVVATGNDGAITISPASQNKLCGTVNADISAESLAHFRPTQYKDVYGTNRRGGGGGGFDLIRRRGAGYTTTRNTTKNTKKSGIYVTIVKDKGVQCIPGAFMIFKAGGPIVMARGQYQNSGETHDFKFGKSRLPIQKLNTKSVYWAVMHPTSTAKWEPPVYEEFAKETLRQIALLIPD